MRWGLNRVLIVLGLCLVPLCVIPLIILTGTGGPGSELETVSKAVAVPRSNSAQNQCGHADLSVGVEDYERAVKRASYLVFGLGKLDVCHHEDPESFRDPFSTLRERLATHVTPGFRGHIGCIVYLAQKKHNSYGRNSLELLEKSIDLLYQNYNSKHRAHVLVFHTGDFDADDELHLRRNGTRNEIFTIALEDGGPFWQLPGNIDPSTEGSWRDEAFSRGYRHMCRWYAHFVFEFVHKLGFEYVMRMDEDSFLLSEIDYDIFEFIRSNEFEYGFRVDAIEPCCDRRFRDLYIKEFFTHEPPSAFVKDCCLNQQNEHNGYGYYNNFFVTKVDFWLQPRVRRLFAFIDWTGGIYRYRENDLIIQALSIQQYMEKSKVHKFIDFSYQHVTGERCEWGAVVRGNRDNSGLVDQIIISYLAKNAKAFVVPSAKGKGKFFDSLYCDESTYSAAEVINYHKIPHTFHTSTRRAGKPNQLRVKIPAFCADYATHGAPKKQPLPRLSYHQPETQVMRNEDFYDASQTLTLKLKGLLNCTERGASMWLDPVECGAGCSLNYLVKPLMHALDTGQAVLTPEFRWANKHACPVAHGRMLSCFFQPWAVSKSTLGKACAKSPRAREYYFSARSTESRPSPEDKFEPESGLASGRAIRWRVIDQDDKSGLYTGDQALPHGTIREFQQLGTFWNVGQVLKFITRPSLMMESRLAELLVSLGLDTPNAENPVLGVHIRQGDSCTDPYHHLKGRKCDPLAAYIPAIENMIKTFGFKKIYLATDSAQVIQEAELRYPHLNWTYNRGLDRSKYSVFEQFAQENVTIENLFARDPRLLNAGFTPFHEFTDFLLDVLVLALHTDGFVGKFSSNMDRIVAALAAATGNEEGTCIKPMVSLDADWCFDFMVNAGKSGKDSFLC